jgi:hypothetical protein
MSKQTLNNGESGLTIRGKINSNFTELYRLQLFHKDNGSSAVTGTLNETALAYVLLPGGTMGVNDSYTVTATSTKSGTAGSYNIRVRVHTAAPTVGAAFSSGTVVANVAPAAASALWHKIRRTVDFKNSVSSQIVFPVSASTGTNDDAMNTTVTGTTLTDDYATDKYIVITGMLGNIADTVTLQSWKLEIERS